MKPKIAEISIRKPDDDLVRHLEKLLQYAKEGELTGMVYASVWQGNNVDSGWAGFPHGYARTILGELSILQHDIAGRLLDDE